MTVVHCYSNVKVSKMTNINCCVKGVLSIITTSAKYLYQNAGRYSKREPSVNQKCSMLYSYIWNVKRGSGEAL